MPSQFGKRIILMEKKHPMGVGDAATLAQCCPSIHETPYKWGLVVCLFHSYISNLRTTSHP